MKATVALGAKDETTSWEEYFKNQNKLLSKFVHPQLSRLLCLCLEKNFRDPEAVRRSWRGIRQARTLNPAWIFSEGPPRQI